MKLQYAGDDPDSYANIFDNAKTDVSDADQARLIASLKALSEGGDVSQAVDVDQVLRYFVVHNFVVNDDSYTGTIPSTDEGQKADSSALIDTTGLTLSDMGTMGGGFRGRAGPGAGDCVPVPAAGVHPAKENKRQSQVPAGRH